MFGMGFMEIFLVLIVAVMALGPEKLPSAAVDMVKFFKKFKASIDDAKSTLDNELNISQMKEEANKFKASINEVQSVANLGFDDVSAFEDEISNVETKKKIEKKQVDNSSSNPESITSLKVEKKVTVKKENISFEKEVNV